MKTALHSVFVAILFVTTTTITANNIQVSNPSLTDELMGVSVKVTFDISWENSWRVTSAPSNWDAAWVFIKFRERGGVWRHAWLSNAGHESGSGTASTFSVGLKNDKLAYNAASNPGIGVMVHRSAVGSGTFSATGMSLLWNYGTGGQGISSLDCVEIQVFAIEMVLVPEGPFFLGDGYSGCCTGVFRQVENLPFYVTTSGAVVKSENYDDDEALKGTGIWLDGDDGVSRSLPSAEDMNADFPTGYRGYYVMKYELSQGHYRDFLNTLTRIQQNERTQTNISLPIISNRYIMSESSTIQTRNGLRCDASLPSLSPVTIYCDLDGDGVPNEENDGEWLACNYLSWNDQLSYLDWSGLRPMTELEYEKACRGPNGAVVFEFAWGTSLRGNDASYSINSSGSALEEIIEGYATPSNIGNGVGNALASYENDIFPIRVGIFSSNPLNSGRITSGAGYYGVMEMTGNVAEQTVTLGDVIGRNYAGNHGDGELSTDGNANEFSWPPALILPSDNKGYGLRGFPSFNGSVSNRNWASVNMNFYRVAIVGIRGCRSVSYSGVSN
jgi:formylglycine-generating enzyme required for sulfatase activity